MNNRVILAALALLLLAGCVTQVPTAERAAQAAPTATPAGPTVTLADPNARAREAVNNAWFVAETSTAEAVNAISTQVAFDRARAEATASVERANAAATQVAGSMQMTATAGAIALQNAQADVTATAQALGLADTVATAEAARAKELETEAKETERKAERADLDWQVRFILGLVAAVMIVVLGGFAGWQVVKLLAVILGIEARRRLIDYRAGVYIDAQSGEPRALPNGTPAPLLLDEPTRAERLRDAINPELVEGAMRASEREVRKAWKLAAHAFLRWSEVVPRGEDDPIGFNRRRLCDAARITQDTYHAMIGFLTDLGLIEKENPANPRSPWVLARRDGQSLTVSQAIRCTVWLTSFRTPDVPSTPLIYTPPRENPYNQTKPNQPNQTKPNQETSENGAETAPRTRWNLSLPPESLGDIGGEEAAEAG
jgi:hypothetical protein